MSLEFILTFSAIIMIALMQVVLWSFVIIATLSKMISCINKFIIIDVKTIFMIEVISVIMATYFVLLQIDYLILIFLMNT